MVLGGNGMIGSAMLRVLSEQNGWKVTGVVRSESAKSHFSESIACNMLACGDLLAADTLPRLFESTLPDVVVNCVGLTKHVPTSTDLLTAIATNALLPHRIALLCRLVGVRLIHVSTDCVFSGTKGSYKETDSADAPDIYGRSKALGEVSGPGMITLRTSTIGHEIGTKHGLLEWFLSQTQCKGFARAVFSGLPSVIFARLVRDNIIPDGKLEGLYHVAGPAISKEDLLRIIASVYKVNVEIYSDYKFVIDRSLDACLFNEATGYSPVPWPEMIATMHEDYEKELSRHV